MHIRPKAYLHLIWLWRLLRDAIPPDRGEARARASPTLVYAAVVLAFLLAVLEIDAHRGLLEALGLLASDHALTAFVGP